MRTCTSKLSLVTLFWMALPASAPAAAPAPPPPRRKAALLRLAVLLHRAHESDPIPTLELTADDTRLSLILSQSWIDSRPLLRADLIGEVESMAGLGIAFKPFVT
ncbi:hypothetical protein XVE_4600 [Xanthomonas vesicatoria ATCC 35937]|uniref:Ppx/GppA phosphatase C-terminal domain-containing protein n=1 Tax=Xanthomonas vesicatoria ATCC 35937 TaxID=925775 RepID=F0BJY7_9XANT|nr:hypothetical protein XVE_4600 [Xanthomonas vesicatoria ATCC 35937]